MHGVNGKFLYNGLKIFCNRRQRVSGVAGRKVVNSGGVATNQQENFSGYSKNQIEGS